MTNPSNKNTTNQSWGGRFKQSNHELVQAFGASINFDYRLAQYDIEGSIAHAMMLNKVGVLTDEEKIIIIDGLNQVLTEINNNTFTYSVALEDIHMNIEARLIKICGEAGKKLHTGRSRNDQIATDIRLFVRANLKTLMTQVLELQNAFVTLAKDNINTIMPGFTHLQAAQPVSFAHHLMAYVAMLTRDKERLEDCYKRTNTLPLGAAALAGTSYPIDREYTAQLLGFDRICQNSLDAVSDRDFAIEFTSSASIMMMHLSRLCEEIILWSSAQFNFIELSDGFCTGSSIMPQKKNPDVAELIRGKTSRVYGNLTTLLTLMKSQPLAYNKDNQEDKEPLFDTVDTLSVCLEVLTAMIPAIGVKADVMRKSTLLGFTTATDLADYLVKKGLPFRDAHHVVGQTVAYCIEVDLDIAQLSLETLQSLHASIENDVFEVLSLEGSMNARDHLGGTAPNQVLAAIRRFESEQ